MPRPRAAAPPGGGREWSGKACGARPGHQPSCGACAAAAAAWLARACPLALTRIRTLAMVDTRSASKRGKAPKYSVLLPTYNERENIALIVYLLVETFEQQ